MKKQNYYTIYSEMVLKNKWAKVECKDCVPSVWYVKSARKENFEIHEIEMEMFNYEIGFVTKIYSISKFIELIHNKIGDNCTFKFYENPYNRIL